MKPKVSILCTGSEILDARIFDTNSNLICKRLKSIGVDVHHIGACRDYIDDIKLNLNFLVSSSDVVIVSGGLGPTSDDLTRNAIAELVGQALECNQQELNKLKQLYQRRQRKFEDTNNRQAFFPVKAEILNNPIGTAAGFSVDFHCKSIFSLPGVPSELSAMLDQSILPWFQGKFPKIHPPPSRTLRLFGLAEAGIGQIVDANDKPDSLEVSYKASFPEVCLRFVSQSISEGTPSTLDEFTLKIANQLGREFIFADNEDISFQEAVIDLARKHQLSISAAESCTGGLVGAMLTEVSGASDVFLGSAVCYSNKAKEQILNIPQEILNNHGAVSHETARAMAVGALKVFNSNLAIAITGVSGPSGGSDEKPTGTFFLGFATQDTVESHHCFISTTRSMHRKYSAYTALDLIRRYILKLAPVHSRILYTNKCT